MIDGYDLRTLNLPNYRNHVATVSQEPILFDCSIRDNIVYGLENSVTHEQIVQAAKLANIHDFILNLPQVAISRKNWSDMQINVYHPWSSVTLCSIMLFTF